MGVGACSPIYASGENPQATDMLYREVLGLMQERVPNTLQSIHLHCFNGDSAMVGRLPRNILWFFKYGEGVWRPTNGGSKPFQETGSSWSLTSPPSPRCDRIYKPPGPFVQGGRGGRSGEGPISIGRPPGRYCQWESFVPEELVRLVRGENWREQKGGWGWRTVE